MKTNKLLNIMLALVVGFAFFSCVEDDDYNIPELEIVEPNITTNTTISIVKDMYTGSLVDFTEASNEGELIVSGYVVSNDEAGNFYKTLIIQDEPENPTAAIQLDIDATALYGQFAPGRKVYVKLNGLGMNDSNGVLHIGFIDGSSISRIPEPVLGDYVVRSSEVATLVPMVITPDQYNDSYINMLVQIDDMQLSNDEVGLPYANADDTYTVNRTLVNCTDDSQTLIRNSGYADFKNELFPTGKGSVIAVFSKYNSDYQLFIRDTDDIMFDQERCGDNGGTNTDCDFTLTTETLPFTEDWSSYGSSPDYEDIVSPWISYAETGDREFSIKNFSGTNYAQMSGYNSSPTGTTFKSWLISPKVDISTATQKTISFKMADAYSNGNPLKLYYSTDFDGSDCPQNFTWTEIGQSEITALSQNSGSYDNVYEPTGDIDISTITGEAVFALVYEGSDTGITTTVQISELSIGGESSGGSSGGTTTPGDTLAFAGGDFEDFAAFTAGINSYGIKDYATESAGNGVDGSTALSINTTGASGNDYVFTSLAYDGLPSTYSSITFYVKGTSSKSISINLYKTDGSYYKYNLGDISGNATIAASASNQYTGVIDTGGEWVQITLDLAGITDLNVSDTAANFFALKVGKEVAYDLYLDNFTIQ